MMEGSICSASSMAYTLGWTTSVANLRTAARVRARQSLCIISSRRVAGRRERTRISEHLLLLAESIQRAERGLGGLGGEGAARGEKR